MQIFRLIIKKQHYYLLIYRKTVTCEVTEFFNKSIMGKGMPEMRNYSLFIFLNL